ncbi:redoxin domain-containing protein [Solwaraspora sp. WMMA2101]|uniref:redoxin domain-containing protein n=1 Tax=Solwaraspora sp. WMMA2101 TaxID=3404124 RepID=UPI003B94275F
MSTGEGVPMPDAAAPDFCLPVGAGRWLRLASLRGRPVVLLFYPADDSPVCAAQLAGCTAALAQFDRYGAVLLGLSVDGYRSHRALAQRQGIGFPLLSDSVPRGAVARRYGVYQPQGAVAGRAVFVLDRDGVVTYTHLSSIDDDPGVDGILDAIRRLPPGEPATVPAYSSDISFYPAFTG